MTPEGVAKAVEPDPQNDEICRLKADLARVTAERDRLMDRIHGAQAVILGWVCAETDEVILTMLEMITEELRPSDKALENEERPTHKFQPGDYDEDGGVIPSVESEDE
jgi:hypothetical protein